MLLKLPKNVFEGKMTLYPKYLMRRVFVKGKSSFFSDGYKFLYPDCQKHGMTPWQHYVLEGKSKGYDNGTHPSDNVFFGEGYETEYPDVKLSHRNAWNHYVMSGQHEGRDNGLHPKEDIFFADGYLVMYPDIAKSGLDPWRHYVRYGRKEGRDNGLHPNANIFLAEGYLSIYPDIAKSGLEPWHHYVRYGKKECRKNGYVPKLQCVKWPAAEHFYSKSVLIIAELALPFGKMYRVDQKVLALKKQGYRVFVSSWTDKVKCIKLMQFCSVVIFYRVPHFAPLVDCYKEAQRLGVHTIYDIDDLIFNWDAFAGTSDGNDFPEVYKSYLTNDSRIYRDAMLLADDAWFSTKTLCNISDKSYGTHGICIPTCIPEELSKAAEEFPAEKKNSKKLKIFYGSFSVNDYDSEFIKACLEPVLNKNENVELVIVGDCNIKYRKSELGKRINFVERLDLVDYYFLVSQCDIAVIPFESSSFDRTESNIRYIETSMFSIPSICSDLDEISSTIKNGKNGFIAKNRDEWLEYIQLLIENPDKRSSIGKAAYKTVCNSYSLTNLGTRLVSLLEPYTTVKKESILSVNIFYGVSSMGGATVVAERVAEEIQKNSDYEVHVFSTYTDSNDDFGTIRRYSFNGVTVWALNIQGVNLNYSDEKIREIFAGVLDVVSPKLVHFHCIQTLGIDMCLECIERKVPYFVTIHDGWWNCARQFLVDVKGHYCGDNVSSCLMCKERCNVSSSDFYRRRRLAQYALVKAQKVYAPSAYFSALIQRNFPSVREIYTNKNGIIQNECPPDDSYKCVTDKIVLGYFGGREQIKGYFFLKEALESFGQGIDNFKLILIDTDKRNGMEGFIKDDVWPLETEINGYISHDKMREMYGKIDVLIFPSMCKESFGLVVREAIYNDVFVVCSDCGGPSEAIVNNENGLVFPQGDETKFHECLQFLIKNKDFIKSYRTKNFGDVRTFKEQALELLKDFDQVSPRSEAVSYEKHRNGSAADGA